MLDSSLRGGCIMELQTKRRIKSYDALFELMPQMGAQMEMLDCKCAQPAYCFTHYLESGYKEGEM